MIKYKLICQECKKSFDSWFPSSKEFEKLKKMELINCNYCNSLKVNKSLMAPNIVSKSNKKFNLKNNNHIKLKKLKKKIRSYQNFIKHNLEYVGENFVYEARSIHYNTKENKKGIYGKATKEEVKELNDEGIVTQTIPWIDDKEN